MAESKNPREAPISFRAGKLSAAIRRRANRLAEGQIAKRDLARYYLLLARVGLDDRLTRHEAAWLTRAAFDKDVGEFFSGDPFLPEHRDPSQELLDIVESALRQQTIHGREPSELARRVARKVEMMTPLERAALLDAIDMLPATSEEDLYDPGNWAFVGIRLADDPADPPAETQHSTKEGGDGE